MDMLKKHGLKILVHECHCCGSMAECGPPEKIESAYIAKNDLGDVCWEEIPKEEE